MYSHEVRECLRQVEFVLPNVAGMFEKILDVRVYDRQANVHATGLKDEELRKAAKRTRHTDYYEFSVDMDGVNVFWLEDMEGDDEAV